MTIPAERHGSLRPVEAAPLWQVTKVRPAIAVPATPKLRRTTVRVGVFRVTGVL